MRPLLFLPLLLPLVGPAQSYWGTKARWGVQPQISHLPVVLFKYSYGATGVLVVDTVRRAGAEVDVDALACHPGLGLVAWEVTSAGSQMVVLDSTTAAAQDIGDFLPGRHVRGACYDRDLDLFALDHLNDELLHVSAADGSVLTAIPLSLNGAPFDLGGACDLDQVGDGWYVHAGYILYELNIQSGELVAVFTDDVVDTGDNLPGCTGVPPGICGIAELPQAGIGVYVAIDANCEDDLFRYNVLSADSRLELVHDVVSAYNAGAEDLALAVEPWSTSMPSTDQAGPALTAVLMPGEGLRIAAREGVLAGPINLFDSTGRLLRSAVGNGAPTQVLPWSLPRGLFIVRIGTESQRAVRVLVP